MTIPFSVLDLVPIVQGATASDAYRNMVDLAQHVEGWGYERFWLAEHHNMVGIGSSATAVLIGHVAVNTKTLRVGSGGVMLPNHSPLVIAEQFGTLESLFPGRIDLGLGRAPGTDMRTAQALRRDLTSNADHFPQDVVELQALLGPVEPGQVVQAVPGAGLKVPLWILGSSLFGAQLAAALGLPYGFASHFAPDALMQALRVYRERFTPSEQRETPHAMVGVNVIAAETDEEARRLFTSQQQAFTDLHRNARGKLKPPIDNIEDYWSPIEKIRVEQMLSCSVVGSPQTVREGLERLIETTRADELMVVAPLYDHAARLRSFEIVAEVRKSLGA
ncbi:LLM class flavin-dependent oxidoreductase [Azospirillum sp. SYSU D00513]|uniref:LLM class flavin-dependent oxidoreductase n=1 Tax=Azospirillum sp. SYSU D00513 TaxID=2812561 RepID=UPI001A9771FB|nr:LLM class flavin-dependent oxidoreductase [Azospirillum sp. SYSU D00513]